MREEFEDRDLRGAIFWGCDLTGAVFRDVDLRDVTISHAWLADVDIDGRVEGVTINGVDVTDYVNERDPWFPMRAQLSPHDADGLRSAWATLEHEWATTVEDARQLSEAQRHESVGGEWSFVQTLRHLVFAMDKWFTVPILGDATFHPIGMPNSGSVDLEWPGLDRGADPTFDEAVAVRRERSGRLRGHLAGVTEASLTGTVDIRENGPAQVLHCLHVVFEEEFQHLRYARRDLALLTAQGVDP